MRMLQTQNSFRFDSGREGTRKNSRKRKIRDQRNTFVREFTRSELSGVFSKISIWKQIAGKHSRLQVTVRDCSIHKSLRTHIVLVPGIGWYEIQDQT